MEEKNLSLKEKVDTIFDLLNENNPNNKIIRKKLLKIPRKAKVRRGKIKKGWIGILRIDENNNISGEKVKIKGSVFDLKSGTYHATEGSEILFWNGKFPVLVQETKKLNPMKFNGGKNETYGQPYVMAKMLKDTIKTKGKGLGNIVIWIVVIIGGFLLAKYLFKF